MDLSGVYRELEGIRSSSPLAEDLRMEGRACGIEDANEGHRVDDCSDLLTAHAHPASALNSASRSARSNASRACQSLTSGRSRR